MILPNLHNTKDVVSLGLIRSSTQGIRCKFLYHFSYELHFSCRKVNSLWSTIDGDGGTESK